MKRFAANSFILAVLLFASAAGNKTNAQVSVGISYQTFYDELSPYGEWIDYPEYGYVWQPAMGPAFRPYSTGGHWVFSAGFGWTWVSDYSWGWAPFHYGRWFHDPYYGWLWMPGYEWAPAWVMWRGGGDYYGWAPLGPHVSLNVNFSFGRYAPPADYWCFVPRRYITSPRMHRYYINAGRNTTIIHNTTIINRYQRHRNVFVTGPQRGEVERYTNQRIRPVQIREASRPGRMVYRNNEVNVYRPSISQNNRHHTPGKFKRYDRNPVRGNAGNNDRTFRNDHRQNDRFSRDDQRRYGNRNDDRTMQDDRRQNDRFGRDNQRRYEGGNNDRNRFERRTLPPSQTERNSRDRFERRPESRSIERPAPGVQERNNSGRKFERGSADSRPGRGISRDRQQGPQIRNGHNQRQEPARPSHNGKQRGKDRKGE